MTLQLGIKRLQPNTECWPCTKAFCRTLYPRKTMLTSSVLGGKNSKEKKVVPAFIDSFILSTIFMIANSLDNGSGISGVAISLLCNDLN